MRNLRHKLRKTLLSLRNHTPAAAVITLFTMVVMFFILAMVATLFDSCQRKEHVQPQPHWFKHYQHYSEKAYVQFIEDQISKDQDTTLAAILTRDYYRSRNFHPFWTQKGLQEAATDSLISGFQDAYRLHGIPTEYFRLDSLQHAIDKLVKHEVPDNDSLYPHLYRLERQLTDQYLRYACALRYGAVNPKTVHGRKWYYETLSPDSTFILAALNNMSDFTGQIRESAPKTTDYQALQQEMSQLGIPVNFSNTLNDTILQAINTFRRCNGIPETDSLDAETIEKLNRPLQYYKDAVAANLERLRWQKRHQKYQHLFHIFLFLDKETTIPKSIYYHFE